MAKDYSASGYEKFKSHIVKAMFHAKKVDELITLDNINEIAVVGHLNQASSLMHSAQAMHINSIDTNINSDVENLFLQFDEFANEVLTNIEEKDNYQWSDIEYENLKKIYEQCIQN